MEEKELTILMMFYAPGTVLDTLSCPLIVRVKKYWLKHQSYH